MGKLIEAHTNLDPSYPGYINFTREDDGTVSVSLRGDPSTVDGSYVCGYAKDKGLHGRCTPGDEHCNNYCNLAPQKGPMQPHPNRCKITKEGVYATLKLSASDFDALVAGLTEKAHA